MITYADSGRVLQSSLARDLENKGSRIVDLEGLVRALESEKDEFFDQLQLRQAELESSRSRLESLEGQTTEFQYQLREANDRIALLTEELSDARREQESKALNIGPSAEEVSRLLSAAEGKYESRISDLRNRLNTIEREREEGDALWSRKLADKSRELDSLKDILNSSARSREQQSENVQTLKEEIDRLKEEVMASQLRISDMRTQADYAMETEVRYVYVSVGLAKPCCPAMLEWPQVAGRRPYCESLRSATAGRGRQSQRIPAAHA